MLLLVSLPLLGKERIIYNDSTSEAIIPEKQLTEGSILINSKDPSSSYQLMQRVADLWKDNPFLVYGRDPQSQEMVPFNKNSGFCDQFKIAWRVMHGGITTKDQPVDLPPYVKKIQETVVGKDPFCNPAVIEKQSVLERKKIRVLYNYAPIGNKHFLIVPKNHREDFRALTEEEYIEAHQTVLFLIEKLAPVNLYLFHKTGKEAGQSVPHWHWHFIATENEDDWTSRTSFLYRMVFGADPLPELRLNERVKHYRHLFN